MPCEVAFTVAPDTTAPALSETVPEKLPVAWPYTTGLIENSSEETATISFRLVSINAPFFDLIDERRNLALDHRISTSLGARPFVQMCASPQSRLLVRGWKMM